MGDVEEKEEEEEKELNHAILSFRFKFRIESSGTFQKFRIPFCLAAFDMEKRWCNICCSPYHNDSVFKRHIVSVHPELCYKCE